MRDDAFSQVAVAAQTHPAGYGLHKYWARKPHNVVARVLAACDVGPGDLVLDPFCGSGVPLSEAARLGATCVGCDVNPLAVQLTLATLCPPDAADYRQAMTGVLAEAARAFGDRYLAGGQPIRYVVHATVVDCGGCSARVAADQAPKRGRSYLCPTCGARLAFNLQRLVATRPLQIVLADGTTIAADGALERPTPADPACPVDHAFAPNARILAYPGMRTHHLFTARNFAVLAAVADQIEALPAPVRAAARLTLTAAAAQCSRLVAYRNDLRTGGPAWTVPGFWVPPLHLETNPLLHLQARTAKMAKGLADLHAMTGRGPQHKVLQGDIVDHAAALASGARAKLVFLDPPYGDSVPYLEFSTLWNSFLRQAPDPGSDLAVSDRSRGDGSWANYQAGLLRTVGAARRLLRDDGSVVVTFNNKDLRAWQALLQALQHAGLGCRGAFYQHPAVVSAKAQLAQHGSYVGDVYALFQPNNAPPSQDLTDVAAALRQAVAAPAAPAVGADALQNLAVLQWLRSDIAADQLPALPALVDAARHGSRA